MSPHRDVCHHITLCVLSSRYHHSLFPWAAVLHHSACFLWKSKVIVSVFKGKKRIQYMSLYCLPVTQLLLFVLRSCSKDLDCLLMSNLYKIPKTFQIFAFFFLYIYLFIFRLNRNNTLINVASMSSAGQKEKLSAKTNVYLQLFPLSYHSLSGQLNLAFN